MHRHISQVRHGLESGGWSGALRKIHHAMEEGDDLCAGYRSIGAELIRAHS